jgi:hypothetical protein
MSLFGEICPTCGLCRYGSRTEGHGESRGTTTVNRIVIIIGERNPPLSALAGDVGVTGTRWASVELYSLSSPSSVDLRV